MKPRSYVIDDSRTIQALILRLRQVFFAITETTATSMVTAYDTFDWRLYNKGWQLLRRGDRLTLVDAAADQPIGISDLVSAKALRFPADLPASPLRDRLQAVSEMRALLPVVEFRQTTDNIGVLNEDEKTVVRLTVTTFGLDGKPDAVRRCRLEPLTGYTKAARAVATILKEMPLRSAGGAPIFDLMEKSGVSPGDYSSKIKVALDPAMPAADAVRHIMRHLVTVMHRNLPGIREDIDTEFLHDLRVAARRARSLLGQTKGVLDSRTTADLQERLKTIGSITGPVRDLDVYLLAQADTIATVPEFLKPGVVRLFQTLKRRRRYAFQRMLKAMHGPDFTAAMDSLDAFVAGDPHDGGDAASGSRPILELARGIIDKRFGAVIKKGRRISPATADERLHALRIDCKKLRYLLEFFAALSPTAEIGALIKHLKKLQDNLGAFNDLSVQQAFLIDYLGTITPKGADALLLAAATGGLIARLAADQQRVREAFWAVFAAFDTPQNRKRCNALFVQGSSTPHRS